MGKLFGKNAFEQKKKKPTLKFNPGLALIGLWTTEACTLKWSWLRTMGNIPLETYDARVMGRIYIMILIRVDITTISYTTSTKREEK